MTKIVVHDTWNVIDEMPDALMKFQARAVVSVGNDYLMIINQGAPPERARLEVLNLSCSADHVIIVYYDGHEAVLEDSSHLRILRQADEFELFSGTNERVRHIFDLLGVSVELGSLEMYRDANRKRCFQELGPCAHRVGSGFQNGNSFDSVGLVPAGGYAAAADVPALVEFLFRYGHEALRVKPDFSASCIDHRTVRRSQRSNGELRGLLSRCYVAQTFIEHDLEFSIPFEIFPDQSNVIYDPCGQHIVRKADGTDDFNGNFKLKKGVLKGRMFKRAMTATRYHIGELVKLGYAGWGSIDFVGNTKTEEVWAIERNARTTATLYPIRASERLFDGRVMPFNNRGFLFPMNMNSDAVHQHFDGLLLEPGSSVGLVLYCVLSEVHFDSKKPPVGFSYGVTFARTYDELSLLDQEVDNRMHGLTIAA